MAQEKTKVGKFLQGFGKNVAGPIIRTGVKIGLPMIGTPIVELISNIFGAKKVDKVTGAEVPKHSYVSITLQFLTAGAIIYAFHIGAISIQDVIDMLKALNAQ